MLTSLMLGLAVGLILALTGAGGGILAVPLLVFGAHIGVAQAGPIGLMAVGMAAALGAILGLRAGVVRYRAAVLIAVTGTLFSPAGLWLARRIDNRWLSVLFGMLGGRTLSTCLSGPYLQKSFAAVSAAVAVGMIAKVLR
jgi:uncharacterized membrane protein YfcA